MSEIAARLLWKVTENWERDKNVTSGTKLQFLLQSRGVAKRKSALSPRRSRPWGALFPDKGGTFWHKIDERTLLNPLDRIFWPPVKKRMSVKMLVVIFSIRWTFSSSSVFHGSIRWADTARRSALICDTPNYRVIITNLCHFAARFPFPDTLRLFWSPQIPAELPGDLPPSKHQLLFPFFYLFNLPLFHHSGFISLKSFSEGCRKTVPGTHPRVSPSLPPRFLTPLKHLDGSVRQEGRSRVGFSQVRPWRRLKTPVFLILPDLSSWLIALCYCLLPHYLSLPQDNLNSEPWAVVVVLCPPCRTFQLLPRCLHPQ